jgi:hypothetical protein
VNARRHLLAAVATVAIVYAGAAAHAQAPQADTPMTAAEKAEYCRHNAAEYPNDRDVEFCGALGVAAVDAPVHPQADARYATAWYKIDSAEHRDEVGACMISDQGPAELLGNPQMNLTPFSTDDVTDPATGAVVETTIQFHSYTESGEELTSSVTLYKGFARCKADKDAKQAAITAQEKAATNAYQAAKQAAVDKYGAQPSQ